MTSTQSNGNGSTAMVKREETGVSSTTLVHSEVIEPMTWPEMVKMGEQLVKTRMMPEHVRDGASAALIMLTGRELGMQPMRALRSLQVVKGKVVESADSQLSRFKADGGRAEFKHLDEKKAVLWLKHPNGDEHTETWSVEDTQKAGLAGGMHGKYPKAMNRSRVITAGLKSLGWEGGVGNYDPDEARAFTGADEDSAPVTKAAKPAAKYVPDEARKAKVQALLVELGVLEGQGAYYREVAGGASPESDDETDAAISELEARVADKRDREARAKADAVDVVDDNVHGG